MHFYLLTEINQQPTKIENFNRLPTKKLNFNRQPTSEPPHSDPLGGWEGEGLRFGCGRLFEFE